MYEIVLTRIQNINGENVWIEVKTENPTTAGNIQQGTTICKALNETCEEGECYHLRQN